MKSLAYFAALVTTLAACGPGNDDLRGKLDNRAKFDMNCPNLQVVPLEETRGYVTSYGVTGCGRRVTYILNASTASWVMNVSDGQSVSAGPVQAPPPPPPNPK